MKGWPDTPQLPCPVCGVKYPRRWDLEYEIITCKKHSFQYPMRLDFVDDFYQEAFRHYVDEQPNFTARANVYTPERWRRMAEKFMQTVPAESGEGRFDW